MFAKRLLAEQMEERERERERERGGEGSLDGSLLHKESYSFMSFS